MKKVLIVEDSRLIAGAIKLVLENQNIQVQHLTDGSLVLEDVKKNMYDLIVLDLMMPGVSGIDVFKQLKADTQTKDVKVLILTAKADAIRADNFLANCDSFITKPFDNDSLVKEIKRLLGM
ncbi:MAG: response regulator transcription factor [Candidatus Woesearchaeota archaeon]